MKARFWLPATLAAAAMLFTACGDDDDPTPTATSGLSTNIPSVNEAIDAALDGDVAALTRQTSTQSLACVENPSGPIPAPPKCLAGQAPGTMVPVILIGTGQSVYRQESELPQVWTEWLGTSRETYAIKKLDGATETYLVVFKRNDGAGTTLEITPSDGIVRIGFDPSFNPKQQAEGPPGTFIIAPK